MSTNRHNPHSLRYSLFIPVVIGITMIAASCLTGKKTVKHNKKYMDRTYNSMKASLPEAKVLMQSDTVKVIFNNAILFDFNSAEINPKVFPSFEHFAAVLNEYKKTEILIVGHTDSIGGDNSNNRELSTRRADSAANLLQYYKVDGARIEKWGMGAGEPLASNETEEGRAKNRRVEFHILYDYKKGK